MSEIEKITNKQMYKQTNKHNIVVRKRNVEVLKRMNIFSRKCVASRGKMLYFVVICFRGLTVLSQLHTLYLIESQKIGCL